MQLNIIFLALVILQSHLKLWKEIIYVIRTDCMHSSELYIQFAIVCAAHMCSSLLVSRSFLACESLSINR